MSSRVRCALCGHFYLQSESLKSERCLRCGLAFEASLSVRVVGDSKSWELPNIDAPGTDKTGCPMLRNLQQETLPNPITMTNVAYSDTQYAFEIKRLLASTTGLSSDLVSMIMDFLLWYRGPKDFRIGDAVDACDCRGNWLPAHVIDLRNDEILVEFDGWPRKWNAWLSRTSSRLLPYGTITRHANILSSLSRNSPA